MFIQTERVRISLLVLLLVMIMDVNAQSLTEVSDSVIPFISCYDGTQLREKVNLSIKNNERIILSDNTEWELTICQHTVSEQPDATDYQLTWTLTKGEAKEVAVGVSFPFTDWSVDNFVMVPAAVYAGNRFEVKDMAYPPYWYDQKEWRLDMPTTTTLAPALSKYENNSKIELTTGNASTPLMAFYAPEKNLGWMVLTTQGSHLGNHGLFIEEDKKKAETIFSVMAPAVREKRATGSGFAPSGDKAADWKTGDQVSVQFRVYTFSASSIQDLYKRFSEVRKELNPSKRHEELPFSELWNLMNNLYQQDRWDETIDMYWLSKVGANTTWNHIWQLGWCGGGQVTLPLMMQGSDEVKQRALKNLEAIFSRTQTASGLFNAYGNGHEFASFGFGSAFKYNETFVRSQGDWLYIAQRQFREIESTGGVVPEYWKSGLKKQADCFERIWEKYNQFGQFVDVTTGDICIGGSTAGAIVPAGLALASQTYGQSGYLKVAEAAARKYYQDYVLKGYTTGGPAEILSTPDSESAFALFETFMTLYEVSDNKEWLDYASDLLPICASWTVSYDFKFPVNSEMGRIQARSCGAVWASVANKHGAPGICTWSGDCLLKYFRATGDERAMELLVDIAHGFPQYVSRWDRPIGRMPSGGCCERVNLSDWEGINGVGGSIFGSCSWVETTGLLIATQLPGLYVLPDEKYYIVLDNIEVSQLSSGNEPLKLLLMNPTKFPAEVKVYQESLAEARKTMFNIRSDKMKLIHLNPGESKELSF